MNRAGNRFFIAVVSVLSLVSCSQAEDALSGKDLDKRLDRGLYDVTAAAVKVFNSGNEEGCARMFEGGLLMALPLLDYRPELKKRVEDRLAKARAAQSVADRAFMLREAVDDIRSTIKKSPSLGVMPPPKPKTLWDRLGGEPAVKKVVHDFVAAAAKDPKVNFSRGGKYKLDDKAVAHLEKQLVDFISSATGGPLNYTGKSMKAAHMGMGITEAEFNAAATDLKEALKKHNVPQKETDELMAIVSGTKKDIVEKK